MRELASTAVDGPLNEAQIASFRKDVLVHLAGLIDDRRLAELRSWVDDIQGWPGTPARYRMYVEQIAGELPSTC